MTTEADPSDWPLASVCVINFNYGRFLADAVDSALAQTYPRVEIIVVDDGSTDDSREVIAGYGDRVRSVFKENGGQGSSFNAAFAAARGEILFILDADDMYMPDVVERVVEEFRRDPGLAKVQYRMEVVDANAESMGEFVHGEVGVLPSGDLSRHVLRYRNYPSVPTSASAWSTRALTLLLPLPEDRYRANADAYLNEQINLCGRIRSLDYVGVRYRMHGKNDYLGRPVEAGWFQGKIDQVILGHENVRGLCTRLGIEGCAEKATDVRDCAFMTFRLASLKLDRANHPLPEDRWWRLAPQGIIATLCHPYLHGVDRLKRVGWFLAVGPAPGPIARRLLRFYTPDGPGNRRLVRMYRQRFSALPSGPAPVAEGVVE